MGFASGTDTTPSQKLAFGLDADNSLDGPFYSKIYLE